jgi:hypothetical protein
LQTILPPLAPAMVAFAQILNEPPSPALAVQHLLPSFAGLTFVSWHSAVDSQKRTVALEHDKRPLKSVVHAVGALHVVAALVIWHDCVLPFPVIVPQHTTPDASGGYAASGLPPSTQFAGSRHVMLNASVPPSVGVVSALTSLVLVSLAASPPVSGFVVLSLAASLPPSVPLSSPPQA